MFVGEDAPNRDKDDKSEHYEVQKGYDGLLLDISGEENSGTEKDGSGDHSVSGGEARLARTIWASVPNEDMVEEEINNYKKGQWHNESQESLVDFFERFASNPLINSHYCKDANGGDGGVNHNVCCFVPIHRLIIAQKIALRL